MDLDRWGEVGGRKHCNQNALYKRNVFLTKKKQKKISKQNQQNKQMNKSERNFFPRTELLDVHSSLVSWLWLWGYG